jgi:hypothetical protein
MDKYHLEPTYEVVSPVGEHKLYSVKEYHSHIFNLNPPPQRIIYGIDTEISEDFMINNQFDYIFVDQTETVNQDGESDIHYIAHARDELRKIFLGDCCNWLFMIDSDIFVPPHAFMTLWTLAIHNRCLMVINQIPGREDHCWHGVSCTLAHRRLMNANAFSVLEFSYPDEFKERKRYHISEDTTFIEQFSSIDWWLKSGNLPFFRKAIITGSWLNVEHQMNQNKRVKLWNQI